MSKELRLLSAETEAPDERTDAHPASADDSASLAGTRPRAKRKGRVQPQDTPGSRAGAGPLDAISLAEGGLLADVGVILDLASIYIPIVGTVLGPAVPTPFVVLTLRRGPRVALISAAVAAFLVTIFSGPHFGWRMGLEAVVGLLLGWAMQRRMRPLLIWGLGTIVVAIVTFIAALGVIFVTGLPIQDIVAELRNGFGLAAWVVATGAALVGGQGQWLAIRPVLVFVGLLALRLWPLTLFAYVTAFALPTVGFYYAVANATARVLGHDVSSFPPRWLLDIAGWLMRVSMAVLLLPYHIVGRTMRMRRLSATGAGSKGDE